MGSKGALMPLGTAGREFPLGTRLPPGYIPPQAAPAGDWHLCCEDVNERPALAWGQAHVAIAAANLRPRGRHSRSSVRLVIEFAGGVGCGFQHQVAGSRCRNAEYSQPPTRGSKSTVFDFPVSVSATKNATPKYLPYA